MVKKGLPAIHPGEFLGEILEESANVLPVYIRSLMPDFRSRFIQPGLAR